MSDEAYQKLDEIFSAIENRKSAEKQAEYKKITERKEREVKFHKIRDDVIMPEMKNIGLYLITKGYAHQLTTEKKYNIERDPFIKFTIVPEGYVPPNSITVSLPYFEVRLSPTSDTVYFQRSTALPNMSGVAGSAGKAEFSELTNSYIKEKLINYVSDVFKRA